MSALLLIGPLHFVRPEWEQLGELKGITKLKEFVDGDRQQFLEACKSGQYDNVVYMYRSNESVKLTGPFDQELVDALPSSLKYICHNGAGYDNIDVAACTAKGLKISSTPKAVDNATADTGIFLMLGALRHANIPLTTLRSNQWGRIPTPMGHDPSGKLLGILGMGSIGRNMAAKARAFGMKIQYHNRRRLSPELEAGAEYVDFETLLKTSDVFSLNLALNEKTRHIIGKGELRKMKRGVTIVNTARGALIDEAALVEALNDGDRIWSVGLDVFEEEPKVHPGLMSNQRAFLLPHIGTATSETRRSMELLVLENIRSAVEEGKLVTPIPEQASM